MPSSPIANFLLTNAMETYDDDEIQSVHLSVSKNVGKEVSIKPIDLYQYN